MSKSRIVSFPLILLVMIFIFSTAAAQGKGEITGRVVDAETGEGLIGANVFLESTSYGAATDIDGRYTIKGIPVETYNVIFSMVGYNKKTVTGVKITEKDVQKLDITLSTEAIETEEVVITASAVEDSEAGLLIKRQKSTSVSDAISAEQISRTGAGDAADAVKQVVGASVVDGKYVYVRGLGERYSATQLNGAELPSSDPNKKAFQLDLLPSNLLENITTIKTFTPDKPGNFSGGIVDIGTKSFPEKLTLKVSSSATYNSNASYNSNFISYQGGSRDWLGYDDGTRELPKIVSSPEIILPEGSFAIQARRDYDKAMLLDEVSRSFNRTMYLESGSVPVNQGYSFSIGNKIETGDESSFGYLGSLTYSRSFSMYKDAQIGRYSLTQGSETLTPDLLLTEQRGKAETSTGALVSLAYNISNNHQVGGNFFYSNSGQSDTRDQQGDWVVQFGLDDPRTVFNKVLGYTRRDVKSYQVNGEHNFPFLLNSNLNWSVSLAKTTQDDPDRRFIFYNDNFSNGQRTWNILGSNVDDPTRYFRSLVDNADTYTLDYRVPFKQWSGLSSSVKTGFYYQETDRSFSERLVGYHFDRSANTLLTELDGDLNQFFNRLTIGLADSSNGRYNFDNYVYVTNSDGNYTGSQKLTAGYMMVELPILRRLKFIGGARYETTDMIATPQDTTKEIGQIVENDLLPSANLVYALSENMNLRAAYTKTLARPNFREISPFSDKEFINGRVLKGNPELERTLITNYDLRWEWFTRPGEILAVSVFYKEMENPIEIGFDRGAIKANQIMSYFNVPKADIQGLEFEARLGLDHFGNLFENFYFGGNLSIIEATIDIPPWEQVIRDSIDQSLSDTRDFQGQSPYILNLDFGYNNYETGTSVNLHFNTFGERLAVVTGFSDPDVYEQPSAKLDLIFSQKVLPNFTIKGGVKNILDAEYKEIYKYKGKEYTYYSYREGRAYSLGVSFTL